MSVHWKFPIQRTFILYDSALAPFLTIFFLLSIDDCIHVVLLKIT